MVKIKIRKGAISTDTIIYAVIAILVLFVIWLVVTGNFNKVGDTLSKAWSWLFDWFKPQPPSNIP